MSICLSMTSGRIMADEPRRLSIAEQGEYLAALLQGCSMADSSVPHETWIRLGPDDVEELGRIATRLRRMGPHEGAVRRLVEGRAK
ncbi:MAG: hypothetical protein HC900_00185 [Methylacidiphilales bacterium]|nr:hypothetical protein [Candidatus Methylacidiphilales bacterium]